MNGFCARPKGVRAQYEKELQQTRETLGDAHLQIYALKRWRRLFGNEENS